MMKVKIVKGIRALTVMGCFAFAGTACSKNEDISGDTFQNGNPESTERSKEMLYCVIDLSGGQTAEKYPVSYLSDISTEEWSDEYKTTKLVLRRVPAGEVTYDGEEIEGSAKATITKDFWMGVFEMTQKQYTLVMGENPANFQGDKLPVENLSYDEIRGESSWPTVNSVKQDGVLGRLRAKTGLAFDLPSEAQWMRAAQAGGGTDGSLEERAWTEENSNEKPHEVGLKKPNGLGLYDMQGNLWEWCRDWYWPSRVAEGEDPVGDEEPSLIAIYRCNSAVVLGGGWNKPSSNALLDKRAYKPSNANGGSTIGLRLIVEGKSDQKYVKASGLNEFLNVRMGEPIPDCMSCETNEANFVVCVMRESGDIPEPTMHVATVVEGPIKSRRAAIVSGLWSWKSKDTLSVPLPGGGQERLSRKLRSIFQKQYGESFVQTGKSEWVMPMGDDFIILAVLDSSFGGGGVLVRGVNVKESQRASSDGEEKKPNQIHKLVGLLGKKLEDAIPGQRDYDKLKVKGLWPMTHSGGLPEYVYHTDSHFMGFDDYRVTIHPRTREIVKIAAVWHKRGEDDPLDYQDEAVAAIENTLGKRMSNMGVGRSVNLFDVWVWLKEAPDAPGEGDCLLLEIYNGSDLTGALQALYSEKE